MARFHILGIPHTASNPRYLHCAFTQKVVKLCRMLRQRGHTVIHYGNELSEVDADELVAVTAADEILPPERLFEYRLDAPYYQHFTDNAIRELFQRKEPRDFLLCPFGAPHKAIADAHPDLIAVESGIGYPGGFWAPYKVWESYALMHAAYGLEAVALADKFRWYEIVIPNSFDPTDFTFSGDKRDYLLFLGMRHGGFGKGLHLAMQLAQETGHPLLVAGPSPLPDDAPGNVHHVGIVDAEGRASLLAGARALLAPSVFMEPFCGVSIEALFSGTPVITTDWGAQSENIPHGLVGYRCRTYSEFFWAVEHAPEISPYACRQWAENFTLERVSWQYDEYFNSILDIYGKKGWYEPHPERVNLDSRKRTFGMDVLPPSPPESNGKPKRHRAKKISVAA